MISSSRRIFLSYRTRLLSSKPTSTAVVPNQSAPVTVKPAVAVATAAPVLEKSKSTFGGRISSFLAGLAVGFGGCMWILSDELENSNRVIYDSLEHLDGRVKKLEQQQQ